MLCLSWTHSTWSYTNALSSAQNVQAHCSLKVSSIAHNTSQAAVVFLSLITWMSSLQPWNIQRRIINPFLSFELFNLCVGQCLTTIDYLNLTTIQSCTRNLCVHVCIHDKSEKRCNLSNSAALSANVVFFVDFFKFIFLTVNLFNLLGNGHAGCGIKINLYVCVCITCVYIAHAFSGNQQFDLLEFN